MLQCTQQFRYKDGDYGNFYYLFVEFGKYGFIANRRIRYTLIYCDIHIISVIWKINYVWVSIKKKGSGIYKH